MAPVSLTKICSPPCQYFERLGFKCTRETFFGPPQKNGKLPEPVQVHESYPISENDYQAILEEVLGPEDSQKIIDNITQDKPLTEFFAQIREDPTHLKNYIPRNKRRKVIRRIKTEEQSYGVFPVIGFPCPYEASAQYHKKTLGDHLKGLAKKINPY